MVAERRQSSHGGYAAVSAVITIGDGWLNRAAIARILRGLQESGRPRSSRRRRKLP